MTEYKIAGRGDHVFDTRYEHESTPEEIEASCRDFCGWLIKMVGIRLEPLPAPALASLSFNDAELAQLRELVERESTRRKNPAATTAG
jgi:hypothetical protein